MADLGAVCIFSDKEPHQELDRIWLEPYEMPLCSRVATLKESKSEASIYLTVGSAFITPHDFEPTTGRVLLFDVGKSSSVEPTVVMACVVNGAVYDASVVHGAYLICAVNNTVHIYRVDMRSNEFQQFTEPNNVSIGKELRVVGLQDITMVFSRP